MIRPTLLGVLATFGLYGFAAAAPGAETTPGANPSGGRNATEHLEAPTVVLISIDGYRWDYPERYPSPAIRRLIDSGMRAERLVPAWPTLTFPNHYSLVTGLSPAEHGIVGNEFPDEERWYSLRDREAVGDGSYYGGEPVWVTAERQGMVAASYYWVGSEANVAGVRPTHWRLFDRDVPNADRVEQVLAWLGEPPQTRPRFISLYFEDLDGHSHYQGVGSLEFLGALENIDQALGALLDGIDALPDDVSVYVALVSDHGHRGYEEEAPFVLEDILYLDGLRFVDHGAAAFAWQTAPDAEAARKIAESVNATWARGRAYTQDSAPADWGLGDNPRMPDLVFQADPGYGVLSRRDQARSISAADHGWAPDTPEMQGIFIAAGPGIPPGTTCEALKVTDVQPLVLDWLGLERDGESDAVENSAPGG